MKLSSLTCCDNIIQDPNNRTILVNPFQCIKLLNIPSVFSFSIFVGLLDIDKNGQDTLSVKIEGPNEQTINEVGTISLPIPPQENLDTNMPYTISMNFDVRNMIFNDSGIHKIKIIDIRTNDILGTAFIEVVK